MKSLSVIEPIWARSDIMPPVSQLAYSLGFSTKLRQETVFEHMFIIVHDLKEQNVTSGCHQFRNDTT